MLSFRFLFVKEIVHFSAEFSFPQFMLKLSRLKPGTSFVMSGDLMFLLDVIKMWLIVSLQLDNSCSECQSSVVAWVRKC